MEAMPCSGRNRIFSIANVAKHIALLNACISLSFHPKIAKYYSLGNRDLSLKSRGKQWNNDRSKFPPAFASMFQPCHCVKGNLEHTSALYFILFSSSYTIVTWIFLKAYKCLQRRPWSRIYIFSALLISGQ